MTTADAPLPTRRLNPAEVLLALRDFYVRVVGHDPEWVDDHVRPDTPLADLPDDDLDFAEVLRYLGAWPLPDPKGFDRKFRADSRVADLCVELAELIRVPAVEPVAVLGRPCPSAGAFLTVRRLLADAGVDVSDVAPSTPLGPYLWQRPTVFDRVIARMAPGRLPPLVFRNARLRRRVLGVAAALLGSFLAYQARDKAPVVAGAALAVAVKFGLLDLVLIPLAARRPNGTVEFGDLYDFRDLVDAMLGRPLRRRRVATA